jgi:3',5'-cyclic AMP phosphodiesterase CpdA
MFSRRSLLSGGIASVAGAALGETPFQARPRRVLRVAHLTDIHLTPEGNARTTFARCLDHVQRVTKADVIFQGGDVVMDALTQGRQSVEAQYDLVSRMFRERVDIPIYHCLGNHDVFGWDRPDRKALVRDPFFGKGWWRRFTGYTSTYYSFDRGGWHFVFLDSINENPRRGFTARIDEAQWRWLAADLDAVNDRTPVCIVSHVPILIGAAQFFGPCEGNGRYWTVSGGMAHLDARRLKDLFVRHPNVNLCLSGHTHLSCRVDYNGVAHVGNGAVSGAWWKGDVQETKPGYGVIDFFSNGHFFPRYVTY